MHGLIASSCLHIINHFHRLEPLASSRVKWKHDEMGWASKVWLPHHPSCSSLSCPEKNKPNHPLLPHAPCLLPSPSLLPFSAGFLKESSILMESISSSVLHCPLSPPQTFKHHLPQTPLHDSLSHAGTPSPPPSTQLYESGT